MLTKAELKDYLKEIFYIEEDALMIANKVPLPTHNQKRIHDNIAEKQRIVARIISLINEEKL
jgi:hypothetical protein